MIYRFFKSTLLFVLITTVSCANGTRNQKEIAADKGETSQEQQEAAAIVTGAARTGHYLPLLKGKKVGVVGNQTSIIKSSGNRQVHLIDSLVSLEIDLQKVFAPEHGFRGTADAGEVVKDGRDPRTGLPVLSLYGDNKKPSPEQLEGIEVMIFDIQDVGARFYTYISTLHYVMEACAENGIQLIVLDRPNPNGHYIDGPVLEMEHTSFVGMHPIPVVHGVTIGEYARMINGEKWLKNQIQTDLKVITMENYNHTSEYDLPVKPSPNLPNAQAINLYPSLCFFEGTNVNAGRGTDKQFQVFGSPFLDEEHYNHTYVPVPNEGAKNPKHLNKTCYGKDLSDHEKLNLINLDWLINAYRNTADKSTFFNTFFTKLAGTAELQKQIESGMTSDEIRKSWKTDLDEYAMTREKYLLYP